MKSAPRNSCEARREELTEEQWRLIEPLIPTPPCRANRRGRPWRDARQVLNGVLWILRNDAHWRDLPDRYPPHQTCRRRLQLWMSDGTLKIVLEALAEDLRERGHLDITESSLDEPLAERGDREGASEARGACVSWQWQTAMLLLSRATRRVLRRTRSPLAHKLS